MSYFSYTANDLQELFDDRGNFKQLEKLGGVVNIAKGLRADLSNGLSEKAEGAFTERIQTFGSNVYPERKFKGFFELVWETLQDLTLIILCVAAVISLVLGIAFPNEEEGESRKTGWIEGASILAAVIIVSTVTAGNDYIKDRQFRDLEKEKDNDHVLAIRDGEICKLKVFDLVVGDIVSLERGSRIPADGLYIAGKDFAIDMSALTGEPDAIPKNEKEPFILSGCTVADGEAHMMISAVGVHSQWGQILVELEPDDEDTPLQEDLEDLATKIGWVGLICAVAIFLALTVWWVYSHFVDDNAEDFEWAMLKDFIGYFIVAVTILVVAVPEGLPLAVTISLAYSMRKMMKDNNLVRHLKACETMGSVTNICTDKTGTLTENRMKVVRGWITGTEFEQAPDTNQVSAGVIKLLTEGICVNSKAHIRKADHGVNYEYLGNKTECALLVLAHQLGSDFLQVRRDCPVVKQLQFSSERKRMSTIISLGEEGSDVYRVYCKGGAEMVLALCSHILSDTGEVESLDEEMKQSLLGIFDSFSNDSLRTIVLAYRDLEGWNPEEEYPSKSEEEDDLERDLTFLAVVGIEDPLRADVKTAVRRCQDAGIMVRMVTGDNINTAKSIGKQCGIYSKDGLALEGPVFRKLTAQQAAEALPRLQVLARSTPQDKKLLVKRLKAMGEVVAVTGDGTNDAPALRKAHVGLAMNIEGTGVAKQASDIIILDDNFASIVKSVMWGRNVRENIQKFLQFQLTVNLVALVVAFVAALTGKGMPLKAIQLLWVNLIMDTMAALALGTEAPTPSLLDRPPAGRNYPLISGIMWRNIFGQSAFQLCVLFGILYFGERIFDVEDESIELNTLLFNAFVFCQVFNEINSRKVNREHNVFGGLHTNWIFIAVLVFTVAVQILLVQFGGKVFKTEPLSLELWGYSVAIGAASLVVGAVLRFLPAPDIWCCAIQDRSSLPDEASDDEDSDTEAPDSDKKPKSRSEATPLLH